MSPTDYTESSGKTLVILKWLWDTRNFREPRHHPHKAFHEVRGRDCGREESILLSDVLVNEKSASSAFVSPCPSHVKGIMLARVCDDTFNKRK